MLKKKKPKDILTNKQFEINRKASKHEAKTDRWLVENGLSLNYFNDTPTQLLKAQQQAHLILENNRHLLTPSQLEVLERFKKLMANKRTRERLKPAAAYAVLNISSKINRQLFKQYRHLMAQEQQLIHCYNKGKKRGL